MTPQTILSTPNGHITQSQKGNDVSIIHIEHARCNASVSLFGGQVLTWQPTNQQPVFWLSESSCYQPNKAIRGGIPLCWPWFGAYKNAGNHGFARQMQWQLDKVDITEQAVTVVLTTSGEQLSALWPTPFKLVQTLIFSDKFSQTLTIHNLSDQAVQYTSALHSYFRVSSPENTQITNLNNVPFDDKITLKTAQQDTLTNCVGPIDRIYHNANAQRIHDTVWQRSIEVTSTQCQQWVLWNPGVAGAATMADVHTNGEHEYVCLEAANTQWQTIAANASTTLSQQVSILQE